MPKKAKELSALEVRRLEHPGGEGNATFAVGGADGLLLQVTPNGARQWLLRAVIGRRRRKLGLGPFPEVSLAEAREAAREARGLIRQGRDPVAERRAAQAAMRAAARRLTFAEALDAYHAEKSHEFRSEKHRTQWKTGVERLVGEDLGAMPVADITTQDILRALRPHWLERTDTARRVRGRIEAVLDWATVAGHRVGDNPARWKGNLPQLLAAPRRVAKAGNQPAIALDDMARWWKDLEACDGMATEALRFLTLTAARSGEVRGATWSEVDLERGLWIVPANRMKAEREHRVPLSAAAVDLLRRLPRMADADLVFPAVKGGPLSDMALSACMRRMQEAEEKAGRPGYLDPASKRPAVPHGVRSTFRDWAAERTTYPGEMAELALAHKITNAVEVAYRRGDMIEKRRMMEDWSAFLRGEERGAVIPLRGGSVQ